MVMEVIARGNRVLSSTLNPNAPPFVPLEFRAVEDFSDRWWELVETNPGFRDYWLRECFQPPGEEDEAGETADPFDGDDYAMFSDALADLVSSPVQQVEKKEAVVEGGRGVGRELVPWGAEKWHGRKAAMPVPRYADKAPKIVSVKVCPRNIQQPR